MNAKELAIRAELKIGKTARELSTKYDKPSYQTMLKWEQEIKADTSPPEATAEAVATVVELLPPSKLREEVKALEKGMSGLDMLKISFQTTGLALSDRIAEMTNREDLKVAELKVLTQAFEHTVQAFNAATTIINLVGESNGSDVSALAKFKAGMKS